MGLLHDLLNPNSCKVRVSWHKGRVLPTHTVTGVAMTCGVSEAAEMLACAGMHRQQTSVLGLLGSWRTGRAAVQSQLLGHPCSGHGPTFSDAGRRSQPVATLWQGPGAFRERVLDRLISSANCSNLGLLSCYLWSGHNSVKLHLSEGCISFSFAFPLHGGVGGCVHFLLVLLAIHLPGTKNPLRLAEMNKYFPIMVESITLYRRSYWSL